MLPIVRPTVGGLLACLLGAPLHAQDSGITLRGRVVDAATSAPIASAVVSDFDDRMVATQSSVDGSFRLWTRSGLRLVVQRLGFRPETLAVAGDFVLVKLSPAALTLSPSVIVAERATSAANSREVRALDVAIRPRESSQELLRLAPGLVIAQHAGGGKAEQIFLRGFDADHGTDVALSVDETPVNLVTHAHGQGYADLHFVMPEVIEAVDVRKGPYDVRDGDFATAGAVQFTTRDFVDQARVTLRAGAFGLRAATGLLPIGRLERRSYGYLAGSVGRSDGPFEAPQGLERLNLFGKWTTGLGAAMRLVGSASHYDARWSASGQVPERAVRAGLITRFGAIDSTEGGATARSDASLALRSSGGGAREWMIRAYVTDYRFRLFSNFTFFANDSIDGDGIEQFDARTMTGAHGALHDVGSVLGRPQSWRVGGGVRRDEGTLRLANASGRQRLDDRFVGRSDQRSVYTFASSMISLSDIIRLEVGARYDAVRFFTRGRTSVAPAPVWRQIVSPKATVSVDVGRSATVFLNAGSGFHSNDGRAVTAEDRRSDALPRALGLEIGGRRSWNGGTVAASLWGLDLTSELVYVGDEGTTEASGRTRRAGFDLETRLRLTPWLWMDADVTVARGRFRGLPAEEARIPLAPQRTATAGFTVRDRGPWTGGVRMRHVGSRPANERGDVRAAGYTLWETFASREFSRARFFGAIDNALNVAWNEAQFATTSRLRPERAAVTELHFTPGPPRAVHAGIEIRF